MFSDLNDFCSSYDIALKLYGTLGTDSIEKKLTTLPPIKDNHTLLSKAFDTGYEVTFGTNAEINKKTVSNNSITVKWNKTEDCIEGYQLILYGDYGDYNEIEGTFLQERLRKIKNLKFYALISCLLKSIIFVV